MKDLHDEVRSAFEKEQAGHPPTADMRGSIVAATTMRPHRESRVQLIAVMAALVITALVIVSLVSSRVNAVRSVPSHPNVTGDYGPPPGGVPLVYLQDPKHSGWYVGFDWNGVPQGTIKLAQPVDPNAHLEQSPDGSMFVLAVAAKGGNAQYLDRLGRPVGGASMYESAEMWADDSRHYCTLDTRNPGPGWTLGLRTPGSDSATTHTIVLDSPNLRSGDIAIGFGSCSAANDRAVLVYNYFPRPPEVWVVRISDGKVLSDRTFDTTYSDVSASRDGSLIAVNSARSTGYLAGPTAPNTIVIRASDGAVVANLDPSYGVLGFSADDLFALVATSPYASGVATHLALLNLATGNVIWRYDGDEYLSGFFIEPAGAAFAVMLQQANDREPHPTVTLSFVYGNGIPAGVPGRFLRP